MGGRYVYNSIKVRYTLGLYNIAVTRNVKERILQKSHEIRDNEWLCYVQ